MSVRLVVFDVDGTLIDSQYSIVACMEQAFAAHGLPQPDALAVRRIVGLPLEDGMQVLRPGLSDAEARRLAETYRHCFMTTRMAGQLQEALFPGVEAMLTALAEAGFVLGIATGKSQRGLNAMLERYSLGHHFATLQTGDLPPGKPHPAMLLRAIDEVGVSPAETIMVGDTTFDITMACAAGAVPVGVSWGYHAPAELLAAGAIDTLRAWLDLPPLVSRLVGSAGEGA